MQRKHADDVNLAALSRGVQGRAVHLARASARQTGRQKSVILRSARTMSSAATSALFSSSMTPTAKQPRSQALCRGVRPS